MTQPMKTEVIGTDHSEPGRPAKRTRLARLGRFALVYRTVLLVAIATALEANGGVPPDDKADSAPSLKRFATNAAGSGDQLRTLKTHDDGDSDNAFGTFLSFGLSGGNGATTSIFANSAARRASQAYSAGAAMAELGYGKKNGATFGVALATESFRQLAPLKGTGQTYSGTGLGPFARLGYRRFSATGAAAFGVFDHYGDPENGGYDDSSYDHRAAVNFASLKLGLGFALYQSRNFELSLTGSVTPTWTNAPHGDDELARRFFSSQIGLALNFFPDTSGHALSAASVDVASGCLRHALACGDVTAHGTKLLLEAGAAVGRSLSDGVLRAILRR